MKMIENFNRFFFLIFSLIPILLITGPALPDITITLTFLYFIIIFYALNKSYLFFRKNYLISFSLIFWSSLIFISFFSYNKYLSFQDSLIFIRFLFIPIVGYYLIFNSTKKINFAIKIIFFSVCFVLIDSLFQFYNYTPQEGFGSDLLGFKSNWYGRLTGPFKDELVAGSYVSKFGFLGYIYFLQIRKNKFNNFCAIIYLTLIAIVCFVSAERMSLASYFLGLFILLLFLKNHRLILLISFILSISLNLIIYKTHPIYNDYNIIDSSHYHQGLKIEKIFDCPNQKEKKCKKIINLQPRFTEILKNFKTSTYGEIYNLAFKMFINNPFTGIGINNYKYVCNNYEIYNNLMKNYNCASHPHNIYLQWLTEGGVIVFLFFLIYLIYLFMFIIKNNNNYVLKTISVTNLIILFWPIMSTGSLIKNWNGVLTFFIIAICISTQIIKTNDLQKNY